MATYDKAMSYRNIKRLADHGCNLCQGGGIVRRGGGIVATDEVKVSKLFDGTGRPVSKGRIYMVFSCVRKNLRFERMQNENAGKRSDDQS